ncbi:MAG: TonB-dependent receptor [Saprospiraceae bacterium]|nr:TonB-dependent receptor [Saprospiraceae bacterium]
MSLAALLFFSVLAFGQHSIHITVKDADSGESLPGANIQLNKTSIGATTDANGVAVLNNIPNGKQTLTISFLGYESSKLTLEFPLIETSIEVLLEHHHEEIEEVIVTTTRSSRTIEEIPTRVETIAGEELAEKGNMNASNISMLLRESTGIQVQQTSATSANMNFRIQGLDGRYTQLLQNGFPLYSGFSGGLSIMQIPPLDLRQVEIIKGSSSTLYGGGAIAGIINLITKEPQEERDLNLMLNLISSKGLDLNGFYTQKFGKVGLSLFSSYHLQEPYDPNEDNFSDIPQQRRFNFNPKLFLYFNDQTKLSLAVNTTIEERQGGDMDAILDGANAEHPYVEDNNSARVTTQLQFDRELSENAQFFAKNSVSIFDRELALPDYRFGGKQLSSFSEIGYALQQENAEWVAGVNLWTEAFNEDQFQPNQLLRDYDFLTAGVFMQNTWNLSNDVALESGLRTDYQNEYGWFVLPRVSLYWRVNEAFSTRIGGGLGYKTPTIFLEDSERNNFRNVRPIEVNSSEAETSSGVNWDINFRTALGEDMTLSINQLLFYTRLNNPLIPNVDSLAADILFYENGDGHFDSRGSETNVKLTYKDFKLFAFYALIDARQHYNGLNRPIPLTARHRAGFILMWEEHENFRIGYEAYYTGGQELSDGKRPRSFWTMGLMAEKVWERFSLYINFENFTDTRLSRWQSMVSGTRQNPIFESEIWAPTDGRIINGGIKIRL